MKKASHIGIWLTVLVGGVLAIGFLYRPTCQGGTGNGTGLFEYSFSCRFSPMVDEIIEGDPSIALIELDGQTPRQFKIFGGVSPIYDTISMQWSLNSGYIGRPEGYLLLNLGSNTFDDEGRSGPIDSDHLLELIGIPDRPANRATLRYLLNILEDCHTGQLPRPSHFGYDVEEPMLGRIRHVALGYKVPYFILTWVGVWIFAVTAFYTIKRITRRGAPTGISTSISLPSPSNRASGRT